MQTHNFSLNRICQRNQDSPLDFNRLRMAQTTRNLLRGYKGMRRSRRILYMNPQRPFTVGPLLKRLLSHIPETKIAPIIYSHHYCVAYILIK